VKNLFVGAAGLVVLLVAAALIVPSFINWNEYKDDITAEVEKQTGRTLVIDGDIGLTLLPAPAVVVTDLRLGNISGAHTVDMVRLRSVAVNVAMGPLLQGRIHVEKVRLVDPVVSLEVLADGRTNWELGEPSETGSNESPPAEQSGGDSGQGGGPSLSVQLDSLEIENGVVIYRDDIDETVERIDDLTATVAAQSLQGPFEGEGTLNARGLQTGFKVALGRIDQDPSVPVSLALTPEAGKARFELRGAASDLAGSPAFSGTLKVEAESLAELVQAVGSGDVIPGALSQSMDLAGAITASATHVDVTNVVLHLGKTSATGEISANLDGEPAVSAQLAIAHLNLDSVLKAASPDQTGTNTNDPPARSTEAPTSSASPDNGNDKAPGDERESGLPEGLTVSLALSAEAITYREGIVRNARVNAELAGGEIIVSQISGDLPGATEVAAFGFVTLAKGVPQFDGEMDLKAGDVRGLLGWLGANTRDIPPGRIRSIEMKSNLTAMPDGLRLTDMNLQFDASRVTGSLAAMMADRPTIDADLAIDRIEVDAYLPQRDPAPNTAAKQPAAGDQPAKNTSDGDSTRELDALTAMDAKLKVRVGRLTYQGTPFETVVLDAVLRNGVVSVNDASVGDVAGASAQLAGIIEPLAEKTGTKQLGFEVDVPDLNRLLKALKLPRPDPVSTMGPFALTGTADGPFFTPTVDMTLHAAGGQTTLRGNLEALPNPNFSGEVTLAHVQLVPLLGSLGVDYRPAGPIGALDLAGKLVADPTRVQVSNIRGTVGDTRLEGSIDAKLEEAPPHITADLKTGRLAIDAYLPADKRAMAIPRLIPASWAAPRPLHDRSRTHIHMAADAPHRRWSRAPLDLSVLQQMSADLTLKSEAIIYERTVFENVDAVAKLASGVLMAEPVSGLLSRGPFQAKLRLDANGTPSVDGTLTVKNADLASVTRDSRGRAVATGRMAFDTTVTSSGISTADLVARLDGSGSVRMSNVAAGKGAAGGGTASLINLLQQLNGIAAGLGVSGSQASVTATYRIENGVVRTDDIALTSGLGDGGAQGVIDLPRWDMDVGGQIRLRGNVLTKLMIETKGPPVVPFRIRGSVDDPNVDVNANALQIRRLVIPDPKDIDLDNGLKNLRKLFGK